MTLKAAGPIAIAAILPVTTSPHPLIGVLLVFSVVSLGLYLVATHASVRESLAGVEAA